MTAMARPNPQDHEADHGSIDDDPLVELARIVSGRSNLEEPKRRSVFDDEPGLSEADLARDLEMELLSDLQASFSAAGAGEDDQPPFYAEEDMDEASTAYDPEPVADDLSADALSQYPDETYAELESFQDDGYPEEEAVAPLPEPAPVPQAPAFESAFAGVGLRGSRGGPAYNPNALAEDETEVGAENVEQTAPVTGWAATEEESLATPAPSAPPQQDWTEQATEQSTAQDPFQSEQAFDPTYEGTMAAADAFGAEAAQAPPAPAVARHRDRRLDADPEGIGARHAVRRRTSGRYYTVFGVLALVAIGTAAVLVLRGGDEATGEPPLIAADDGATMVFPEETPVDDAGNVVFQRTDPDETAAAEETILPGAEPMADIAAATEANDAITQILTPTEPDGTEATGDLPRMVRTVTVLTDGTILANGTEPVGEDGAPPAGDTATPTENAGAAPAETPAATDTPAVDPAAETPTPDPVAETPEPAVAETPEPVEVAAATPAETPAAGDPIAPGLYVQVAALGTEALAQSTLQEFRARAPSILQNQPAVIQRAELAAGVYFRVWFGPLTSGDAESLRQRLAAVGIESFIQTQN